MLTAKKIETSTQDELVAALETDHSNADLTAADEAMLDYVVKLTKVPWAIEEADVGRLRAQGFDDAAVHDICAVAAYFAFVNRIADGLGVELEERFDDDG